MKSFIIPIIVGVVTVYILRQLNSFQDWKDTRKICNYIENNTKNERGCYTVSTDAIVAGCNIEPAKVIHLCYKSKEVHKNKHADDQWGLEIYKEQIDSGPNAFVL